MHITPELNERLVRTAPGTPMGNVFRRYWLPACLSEEIPEPDCPPVRVRLLGEDLVAFRDSAGSIGLVSAYCAHRLAPLFFGRNEECGLRCAYHGWKYDTTGACVDMPSEPPYSRFRLRVSITAYPTYEAGQMVFAYLGPTNEMPPPPDYEWLRVPKGHLRVSKTSEDCNYLQAVEGGIDTAHSSFAHNNDLSNTRALRSLDPHPTLDVDEQPWGFTYGSIRSITDDQSYLRVYQFMMPNQQMRANLVDAEGRPRPVPTLDGHLWVPIDDESTNVYNVHYAATEATPISEEMFLETERRNGRHPDDYMTGTYWLRRNKTNDFLIDREVQRTKTFTGIEGVNTQDFALQSDLGGGPIAPRWLEALGSTDRAIEAARRLLLEAADDAEAGHLLRGTDPEPYRSVRAGEAVIPRGLPWRDAAKELTVAAW
jgi:phenylpropionate dioxygenase-like ring-hydroxylating dioxygenase large terminal subunit